MSIKLSAGSSDFSRKCGERGFALLGSDDGTVCLHTVPEEDNPTFHPLCHFSLSEKVVVASEHEPPETEWRASGPLAEEIRRRLEAAIAYQEEHLGFGADDDGVISSLHRALENEVLLVEETEKAILRAAREKLVAAVANMLAVAPYDAVMDAVREALMKHVMKA